MELLNVYREQGEAGFQAKKASYTVAQKLEVLEAMYSQNLSSRESGGKIRDSRKCVLSGSGSADTWKTGSMGLEGEEKKQTADKFQSRKHRYAL